MPTGARYCTLPTCSRYQYQARKQCALPGLVGRVSGPALLRDLMGRLNTCAGEQLCSVRVLQTAIGFDAPNAPKVVWDETVVRTPNPPFLVDASNSLVLN